MLRLLTNCEFRHQANRSLLRLRPLCHTNTAVKITLPDNTSRQYIKTFVHHPSPRCHNP
jgi:hypothetical protein